MRDGPRALALLATVALLAAACGRAEEAPAGGGGTQGPEVISEIGPTEGELSLIAWPGYTEKGWVKPFEQETGCKVTVKYGNTSDEMVNLMRQGGGTLYDGVSASGDATNRLIAAGDVAAIDIGMFEDYDQVMQALQAPPHNTVNGVHYGVPYMWGPNFLMYNTEEVKPAPTSWDVVFEPELDGQPNPYAGRITAYDSPIYIADAALYLKAHRPELGITDPYELTQEQLDAAVDLLAQQAPMISKYWAIYTDEIDGFKSGDMVVGTAWPVNQSLLLADDVPVASVFPEEGMTGWADTWMMSANAPHPNCMLRWMEYTLRADVQTQVAEFYGATPSNAASCEQLRADLGKEADEVYHCGDEDYLSSLALWKTPLADCGDDRGQACMDYSVWTQKWTEIRGA
ncbi:MAG TPA: ABC transporter substrate-binding protein [Actinomycetota bacterium]|nr:ABC transporter substrate-binding protein [Actinomycetota bacterium]